MSPLDIFGVISPSLLFESYRFIDFLPLHICTHTYIYIHIVTEIPSEFGFIHVMYISPSFLLSENTHHIPAFACLGDVR